MYRYMAKLPGTTDQGYDVFISKLNRIEPEFYVMADIVKTYNMHADIWNSQNGTSVGQLIAIDMTGVCLGHVGRINMNVMKKNLSYLQVRVNQIYMGQGLKHNHCKVFKYVFYYFYTSRTLYQSA